VNARADHVLVISIDEEMVKTAEEDGEVVDPTDREFWQIDIRCEVDRSDFSRSCMTWWECSCKLTEEQRGAMLDEGDGPCPSSPTGRHSYVSGLGIAHPSRDCWAQVCDGSSDAAYDLADTHRLEPGEYRVRVLPSAEYVEFDLDEAADTAEAS
jgi:hypothetical protein